MSPVTAYLICILCVMTAPSIRRFLSNRRLLSNSLVIRRSEADKYFSMILFIGASLILTLNTYNADYDLYGYIYGTYSTKLINGRPILFEVLCWCFNRIGIEYQTFRTIVIFVCMFSVYRFILRKGERYSFLIILYLLSAYIMDGIQFRQFISTAIFLYAIPCLTDDETSKGIIKYSLITLIAAGFHPSFILFFLLLVMKVRPKRRIKVACAITILGLVAFVILQKTGMLMDFLSYFVSDDKLQLYFVDETYHSSFSLVLKYILTQPIFMLILLFVNKRIVSMESRNMIYINTIIGINLLLLFLCPIYFYSLQFRRMLRVIFIPSFIALEMMLSRKKDTRILQMALMILFAIVSLYWNVYNNENLIYNLFTFNYLLGN